MTINEIKLRKLTLADLAELKNISQKTYSDAFSWGNTEENMLLYLNSSFNTKKLESEIIENQSAFYFAKYKNETVGYLKINYGSAQTDVNDKDVMELERIYVMEKSQGKRIGEKSRSDVIQIAEKKAVNYLWLGVWGKNEKAIEFYKKQRFTTFNSHAFKMGTEIQTDLLMKLTLQKKPVTNNAETAPFALV